MPPAVLVVGDVFTDILVRPDGPVDHGTDRRAAITLAPGGSGANQAAWLAAEGLAVRFAGRVGAADHAQQAAALRAHGVEPRLAADPGRATGMIVALLSPDGERSFLTDRGANDGLQPADLPPALLDSVRLFHVSGYSLFTPGPRAAVLGLAAEAGRRGIPVSVDAASAGFLREVGPARFLDWTRGFALCIANAAEAALLSGSADPAGQLAVLASHYPAAVVKRGAAGAEAVDATGRCAVPAAPTRAIDTTGAGDAFLAAFLAATLAGLDLRRRLERAVTAGTAAIGHLGGRPLCRPMGPRADPM